MRPKDVDHDALTRIVAKLEALARGLPADELAAFRLLLVAGEDDEVTGFSLELGEIQMQMFMDSRSHVLKTLSHIAKSTDDTQSRVIGNLKP